MKISELILSLQDAMEECGDVNVVVQGGHCDLFVPASQVSYAYKEASESYHFELFGEESLYEDVENPEKIVTVEG